MLEHEEVDTISGLILMLLGRPPEAGDRVSYGRISSRVLSVEGHGVKECLVSLEPGAGQEEAPVVKQEE